MNLTFKAGFNKQWTITDDKIIIGKKEIAISSITKATHQPVKVGSSCGIIEITYGKGMFDYKLLCYPTDKKNQGEQAAAYIFAKIKGEDPNVKLESLKKSQKDGYRKKCGVCGHIFCYTFEDLEKNYQLAKSAVSSSFTAITQTMSGHYASGSIDSQTADQLSSRIVDYTKCPKCGSKNLVNATDEDIERSKSPQGVVIQQNSSADELKKFKELLDQGILTQEEFDAKKKELLGL